MVVVVSDDDVGRLRDTPRTSRAHFFRCIKSSFYSHDLEDKFVWLLVGIDRRSFVRVFRYSSFIPSRTQNQGRLNLATCMP